MPEEKDANPNRQLKGFLVLDGPTGTELIRRGLTPDPVLWTARAALEQPELLAAIHRDYLAAGANIITANTFRAGAFSAAKAGLSLKDARSLVHASLSVATEVIEELDGSDAGPRFLAGSLAPAEDCYKPWLVPRLAELERAHSQTSEWLVEGGCDVVLAETMGTAREAVVAVRAARKAGAASVAVSFITDSTGKKLFGGDGLLATAQACVESGAETVLVNCVHAEVIEKALSELKALVPYGVVLGAYANAQRMNVLMNGDIEWEKDERPVEEQAREYAERVASWFPAFGVRIVGGCCGMTPEYIRAVARKMQR